MNRTPHLPPAGWAAMWALWLPLQAHALDCPRLPEQANRDWEVEVKAAIGRIGGVAGAELATRTRSATTDLMGRLPQADKVYLEQMMYASYCSALRDNKALTEAEREARIRAYNAELRSTLRDTQKAAPAAGDPRDVARRDLARIPVDYTTEAFVDSVAKRKQAVALLFLKAGIDPDAADSRGATALMYAASNGDVVLVAALLKARAGIDPRDRKGATALEWAALAGQVETIRLLLARGPDARSVAAALVYAAQTGRREAVPVLLEQAADKRKLANTALRGAAGSAFVNVDERGLVEVARLLLQRGADVNAPDDDGWTALTFAAQRNRIDMARLLVESGADINHRCACGGWHDGGYTPLAMASNSGRAEIAEMLIAAGADTGVRNNDGETALHIAADRGERRVLAALLATGADPNTNDRKGDSPLIDGALSPAIVRELLAHGAAVNAKGERGVTALINAVAHGRVESATLLLDAGADANAKTDSGLTPLMVAVRNAEIDAARLLLQRGARVGEKDADDKTALAHAEGELTGEQRTKMIALLGKAGAR